MFKQYNSILAHGYRERVLHFWIENNLQRRYKRGAEEGGMEEIDEVKKKRNAYFLSCENTRKSVRSGLYREEMFVSSLLLLFM